MNILNKRWLFPLKLAVLFGLITGYSNVVWIIRYYNYLHYRLYNTVIKLVAIETDRQVLFAVAVLYTIWLVYTGINRLNRRARIVCWSITACGLVAAFWQKYDVIYWFQQFNSLLFRTAYEDSKWQIIVAGIIILSSLCYMGVRRSKAKKSVREVMAVRWKDATALTINLLQFVRLVIRGFERQSWFFSIVVVLFLALNLSMGLLWTGANIASAKRPNVIIVMVDTLRSDHVGSYGYARNATPNIDRFAKESIRFKRAVASSSWTTASVSSFMSSQLPQTTLAVAYGDKVYQSIPQDFDGGGISPRCITIAEKLKDQGYVTTGITSNLQYSIDRNAAQGFDFFDESNTLKSISSPGVVSVAKKWLAANQDKRFFLFTLFLDTHSPYRRHAEFDFDPGYKGKDADIVSVDGPMKNSNGSMKHMRDIYDSSVAYTDHHVGLLLDDLKNRGLYDKSLIVFIADHGEEFRDHGGLFHGSTLYNELVSVPLMIKLPYQTKGRVVDGTFPLIDLFPTILGVLESDTASIHAQGKVVDLDSVKSMRDGYIFGQTNFHNVDLRSVQNRNYKYILDLKKGDGKLFDLINDPLERRNIAAQDPMLAASFRKMLLAKEKEVQPDPSLVQAALRQHAAVRANDRARSERLRSLGYMQ